MWKKIIYQLNLLLICFFLLFIPVIVFAVEPGTGGRNDPGATGAGYLQDIAREGFGDTDYQAGREEFTFFFIVGVVVFWILRVVGVILLLVIIYAGFLWLTAGGNSDQVDQAKKWVTNGTIGIFIIATAYLIVGFLIGAFLQRG
ncbi:MAG: Uncharacterized protein G01um101418_319 [Parcubacteria group bacterium Gr01-1014_18]|nr:MAG: Uncharacterized protein Greene041636_305 [Parcubacteria group bacterium Greene0416_36]TSC81179.1 MAG: Uncharacterized protein G01um101418_319 [Parcubacteria group bacterium Gr01-1014_18]TSC99176.1 MAG: Uncharacterized protein Greene101420_321 [Parcubacteria group bacterium Greene1014_20]TSD07466.1 MAG: Uncharacterized protein Greene07142_165 [Parcubacteria group bacterium Greene0714_2]